MINQPIYFDYNATTPVDERVLSAMLPYFQEKFGNASSNTHAFGWEADFAVRAARKQIAECIGSLPANLIFTSGATESNNIVLMGVSQALRAKGNHIITSCIEHKCVLNCCKYLESIGFEVTYLPVDAQGAINPEFLQQAIRPSTILISIMAANNEIGTLQPLQEISRIAKQHQILFHTDAAQYAGKLRLKVNELSVDFVSFSSHKMYGPKGIGALYIKPLQLMQKHPLIRGGDQEKGIRSGTLNVPGIIGFAKACELAEAELSEEKQRLYALKQNLFFQLQEQIEGIKLNGSLDNSLPGTLNLSIPGIDSAKLLSALRNQAALSTGSACTSHTQEYSHVLKAIGCEEEEGKRSLRISLGRFSKAVDVNNLAKSLVEYVLSESSFALMKRI
jgi:cysteine desulfurase